ncbi:glycosyltransferase family 2 protein [Candidatus Calescamantes bacterium]|nr:glycosyltransferase family 2 protein [Candidatus Calescamantes bacterium]
MLSGIVLTFNSQSTIERCLETLSEVCEEIVVVDSFSTDDTLNVVKRYTDRVFQRAFKNYGDQLNWAMEKVKGDFILVLDSDEELSNVLKKEIEMEIAKEINLDAYSIPRLSKFMGKWMRFSWKGDRVIRLFKRGKANYKERELGSSPEIKGKIGKLKGNILHYPYRDLSHYIKKMNYYTTRAAQEMRKTGRRTHITDLLFRPLAKFLKMYILKGGILDGIPGLILSILSSFYVFIKYAKLWENRS